jgi:hypothetical protein
VSPRPPLRLRPIRGIAAIESLLAVPVLLVIGLGALQFALVYQARHALHVALHEAARAGSVAHAAPEAIRDGLARGLLPWLFGAADLEEFALNALRARAHVAQAEARGWLRLERRSPTEASFADWAEPARDAVGEPIAGVREIPNDDLMHRATRALPAGGVAGRRAGEPIGAASGQTLADANLLQLRLQYGVPLSVPLAGRLLAWTLRAWHGCMRGAARTIGLLRLGAPPASGVAPLPGTCAMLGAAGVELPLLPVTVSATVRMQTPAREAGAAAPLASAQGLPAWPDAVPGAPTSRSDAPAPRPDTPASPPDPTPESTADPSISLPPTDPAANGPSPGPSPVPRSPPPGDAVPTETPPADPAFCSTAAPELTR